MQDVPRDYLLRLTGAGFDILIRGKLFIKSVHSDKKGDRHLQASQERGLFSSESHCERLPLRSISLAILLINLISIFHLFRSKGEHRIGGILFDPSLFVDVLSDSLTGCVREAAGLLKVQSHAGNQNNHLNN